MTDALDSLLQRNVVLDTAGPIVFLGRLVSYDDLVFVLADADLHDCRDGHANKEVYTATAQRDGISVNRKQVMVMRRVVISVSALEDVETGGDGCAPNFPTDDAPDSDLDELEPLGLE